MLGFNRWHLAKLLAAILCIASIVSFAGRILFQRHRRLSRLLRPLRALPSYSTARNIVKSSRALTSIWNCERPMGPWTASVFCRTLNPALRSAL